MQTNPLLIVFLRPTMDVILLLVARSSPTEEGVIMAVAVVSRVTFQLAIFLGARYSLRYLPERWVAAARRHETRTTSSTLLGVTALYPATPLIIALAMTRMRLRSPMCAFIGNALGSAVIYSLMAHQFSDELNRLTNWLVANAGWMTIAISIMVVLMFTIVSLSQGQSHRK
jgi:hypothetical protein